MSNETIYVVKSYNSDSLKGMGDDDTDEAGSDNATVTIR